MARRRVLVAMVTASLVGVAAGTAFALVDDDQVAPPVEKQEVRSMQQLDGRASPPEKRQSTYPFRVNASGETYGSSSDAPSPAAEPDLIMVVADSGQFGYYRRADMGEPENFSSPAQAAAWQASADKPSQLTVYTSDGRTVVGVVTIQE